LRVSPSRKLHRKGVFYYSRLGSSYKGGFLSWSEDEIKKLDEIYKNSNSLKDFLNKARSQSTKSNPSLIRFYYDRKKGLNVIKPKTFSKSFEVKELNQNEVKVEDKNVEADKELKDIYKRMSSDLFGEDETLLEKGFTENEEKPLSKEEGEEEIEEKPFDKTFSKSFQPQLNLSNPLAQLAIAINDHLLYGEKGLIGYRPLEEDEKEVINESSKGVIAQLEYIEDPKARYLFYSYLVPAVARIDLYIDKLASVIRNRGFVKKQFQNVNQNVNQSNNTINLTEQQKEMLENWRKGGFKIDPAFDFNKDIDIVAYRDMKIVRNIGSNFT